ncbi:PREDICTED: uncharacterized protein LOC105558771 [Vollenhovia emeryi]|uniref:uncharacterized protein LOC105558771 n=1 Tax=Vollenhovia emeryi TaxID=411798 RepID=UPI0005F41E6F|nr:PREDICTED: uncharacterized protein LOC105558771 [Vollenhovia emeryi]
MKLDTLEVRDYAKIIDVEQRKQVLSRKMIFQLHQRIQSRINVPISEKEDSIVPQSESQFPSHVTKQFQNVLESRFRRHNSTMTNRQKRKCLLQVIKQVHLELCKVSKIICTIYGVQIAWEIGVTIMGLTASLYNLYVRYIINGYKVAGLVGETFVTLMLCSLHIVRAVLLSRVCKNAADEGNRTMEIIHTFYGCNSDSDMQEEVYLFIIH